MKSVALYLVLIFGVSTGDAEPQNNSSLECFRHKISEMSLPMLEYQKCLSKFVSLPPNNDDSVETNMKLIYKQMCSNSDEMLECDKPFGTMFLSCIDNPPDYLKDYEMAHKVSYAYLCQDEGKKLTELIIDPKQQECFSNIEGMIESADKCGFITLIRMSTDDFCKDIFASTNCIANQIRSECETHGLVDYLEDYFTTVMNLTCYHNGSITSLTEKYST